MNEKVYLFKELNNGYTAIFTDLRKANIFIKYYGLELYDLANEFPIINDDYILRECKVNPDTCDVKEFFS